MWPNQQKQDYFASYSINKNWIPSFPILLQKIAQNDLKFVKKKWAKNCQVGFHQMPPNRTKCSNFSRGRSPKPPLREGVNPLSCSPPLVPLALVPRLRHGLHIVKTSGYAPVKYVLFSHNMYFLLQIITRNNILNHHICS